MSLSQIEIPRPEYNGALSDRLGCRVKVVDCSSLPTGTHKIVKAQRAFQATEQYGIPPILISSGNYARAAAFIANQHKRQVVIALGTQGVSPAEIESDFVEVVYIRDLIAALSRAAQYSQDEPGDLLDPNLAMAYAAYKGHSLVENIAIDITNRLDIEGAEDFKVSGPLYQGTQRIGGSEVFCPNGSGELLFDIVNGGSKDTRFYGVSPIGHPGPNNLHFSHPPTTAADKLATPVYPIWWSHFSNFALQRRNPDLHFVDITEAEIKQTQSIAAQHGFTTEPSASVGLACCIESFRERHRINFMQSEVVTIVLTGRGYTAK
jgi:hypothetical protein